MGQGWDKKRQPPVAGVGKEEKSVSEIVAELRSGGVRKSSYRDKSLKIHGLICAKCGREFEEKERQLLTVHHRDGNHANNPPDGSNWENLCVYCHEDEHSRGRHHFDGEGR